MPEKMLAKALLKKIPNRYGNTLADSELLFCTYQIMTWNKCNLRMAERVNCALSYFIYMLKDATEVGVPADIARNIGACLAHNITGAGDTGLYFCHRGWVCPVCRTLSELSVLSMLPDQDVDYHWAVKQNIQPANIMWNHHKPRNFVCRVAEFNVCDGTWNQLIVTRKPVKKKVPNVKIVKEIVTENTMWCPETMLNYETFLSYYVNTFGRKRTSGCRKKS